MNLFVLFGIMPYADYEMLGIYEKKKVTARNKLGESKILLIFGSWLGALSGVRVLCVDMNFACKCEFIV